MKQPWLKFYPADWRSEPSLRICSVGARGLWMEMLCIMHDADPCGSLVIGGKPVTVAQLAGLVGNISIKQTRALFNELEDAQVFSRDEDGTIFSRRIRRDLAKASQDKANGKSGGNPNLKRKDNRGVNPQDKGEDKAQKPEARSQKPEADPSLRSGAGGGGAAPVDLFFEAYPKHAEEDGVARELERRVAEGVSLADILDGAKRYAADRAGKPADKIASPVGWLQNGRWKDGTRKPAASKPIASPTTFIRRSDPSWNSLADRWKREKGKSPPDGNGGWHFPNDWLEQRENAA